MKYLEILRENGKILMIFSTRSLIYTAIGAVVGLILYGLFKAMGLNIVGLVIMVVLSLIGFSIGTFKIPDNDNFNLTRKVRRNAN